MASLDSVLARFYSASGVVQQVGTDTPVAIRMRYVSTGTVTSVTVTTGSNIVTVTVEPSGTVTKTYAFASFATVGAVVDAINADGLFQAKVLDSLRSLPSATQFVNGAITASVFSEVSGAFSYQVWDVLVDTSAAKYFATRLTVNRGFLRNNLGLTHRVHLQEIAYFATLGGAAANALRVIQVSASGTETTVYGALSVSAALTTINFANGTGKITATETNDLVVILTDSVSIADAAANLLRITGIVE